MTAFSQEDTNALVRGRIHDLEFQVWFTIDGVNFYDFYYWFDHRYINYRFKELVYDTCFDESKFIHPDSKFCQTLSERLIGMSGITFEIMLDFLRKMKFEIEGMF